MRYIFILLVFLSLPLQAHVLVGKKQAYLQKTNGELIQFADVLFKQTKAGLDYQVTIIDKPFDNQFLSMRPFQCIMGNAQVMCHLPYPYAKKSLVLDNDLSSLSLDLLFLHKSSSEYGINLWNGIYYKLELIDNVIVGTAFEVDMNLIASPPDNANTPFSDDEIFKADLSNYVYPKIIIK